MWRLRLSGVLFGLLFLALIAAFIGQFPGLLLGYICLAPWIGLLFGSSIGRLKSGDA